MGADVVVVGALGFVSRSALARRAGRHAEDIEVASAAVRLSATRSGPSAPPRSPAPTPAATFVPSPSSRVAVRAPIFSSALSSALLSTARRKSAWSAWFGCRKPNPARPAMRTRSSDSSPRPPSATARAARRSRRSDARGGRTKGSGTRVAEGGDGPPEEVPAVGFWVISRSASQQPVSCPCIAVSFDDAAAKADGGLTPLRAARSAGRRKRGVDSGSGSGASSKARSIGAASDRPDEPEARGECEPEVSETKEGAKSAAYRSLRAARLEASASSVLFSPSPPCPTPSCGFGGPVRAS